MDEAPLQVGRYVLYDEIASGGMAKVHLGRAQGALGFSKIVAIKRILPHLLGQQEFVEMFVDETRVAARIQHPNVVSTLDAVVTDREVFLVMELVLGESMSRLLRVARNRQQPVPPAIAVAIASGMLRGLHAAHEAKNDRGESLGVVHRDVSPQNVLIGIDGAARVIDFGVARARGRLQTTRDGQIKGKMAYMSPEQLSGMEPDRRTDVYATGVILWEALTGKRLHKGDNDAIVYANVMHSRVPPPSEVASGIAPALDVAVMRALMRDARLRFQTAEEMLHALEAAVPPATPTAVSEWVRSLAGDLIDARAARIAEIERGVAVSATGIPLAVQESGSYPQIGAHPERSAPRSVPSHADVSGSLAYGSTRSMTHEAPPPRTSKVMTAIVVLAIAASLMATALVVVVVKRPALLGLAPPPAQAAPVVVVSAAPVTPPPPPPAPAVDPTPVPPASISASATTSATTSATAAPAKPKPVIAAAPAKPVKPSCDPPWFLDAKGIKRFKPECM